MKAVVFYAPGDIRLEDVPRPKIEVGTDAIVRLTSSAICGTDLHMVRGTMQGMKPGTILGHEGVGIVEEVGREVRNIRTGDRVVIPSTIACGYCSYCRAGYYSQCDNANPTRQGTAFFGGPESTGPFHGMQAEYVRVPFANVGLVKLPEQVSDDQAIMLSDIFPTGYFGADIADISAGDTVAVFGCGPVGLFAIVSAFHFGAGRVIAVDKVQDRLDMARKQNAEVVDFGKEDPVQIIRQLTGGIGVDRVIDAVGVDAMSPQQPQGAKEFQPGDKPGQVLEWAVQAVAKAGKISIIGVYGEQIKEFPIGMCMMKNLSVHSGNCHHRKYIPELVELVRAGVFDPTEILTQRKPISSAIDAYKYFDAREPGWEKVELIPQAA
jgi:threonine dehydrogenase-like Zn-dependent dehydrogenase